MFVFYLFLDINDCSRNPCQNGGSCIDGVNQFTCQCKPGFLGINCEISKYKNAQYECKAGLSVKLIHADDKVGSLSKIECKLKKHHI